MDQPPFQLSSAILDLSMAISQRLGKLEGLQMTMPSIELRRQHQIRTIQSTLAMEGCTLDIKQVTAILEGKRVLGPQADIIAVENAIHVYQKLGDWNPLQVQDLKQAHKVMMQGLVRSPGNFRGQDVGVFAGKKLAHMAPPYDRVPALIKNLFSFLGAKNTTPMLVKSCVFHYEFEFVHPFADGNGRMGRLWQQLLLMRVHPLFEYLSVEALVKQCQEGYYAVLSQCDRAGDATAFVEWMLARIVETLDQFLEQTRPFTQTAETRLAAAAEHFESHPFSRKAYLQLHKQISLATASRDLRAGVESNLLKKQGDRANTVYQFA